MSLSTLLGRSLRYSKNINDQRVEPWGTLMLTSLKVEQNLNTAVSKTVEKHDIIDIGL